MCWSQGPGLPSGWRCCPPRSGEHGERCRERLAHHRTRQVAATVTTVITVHFLRPESDALSRGIQRVWRSASPGPGGSHCSRPEHSCGSRAVFGSWPGGGPTLCSVLCPRTAPHAEQILRKRERRQPFPRGGRSLFTWKVPGRGQCPISQEGAPHPLSHPPFLASLTDWTVLGQKQSKPRDHQSTPFELF